MASRFARASSGVPSFNMQLFTAVSSQAPVAEALQLIRMGADPYAPQIIHGPPVLEAARHANPEHLVAILQAAPLNWQKLTSDQGLAIKHILLQGSVPAVKALVAAGMPLSGPFLEREDALYWAATGKAAIVQLLIERGARAAVPSDGHSPLLRAMAELEEEAPEVCALLLSVEDQALPGAATSMQDALSVLATVPLESEEKGARAAKIITLIVQNGADLDAPVADEMSPLAWALAALNEPVAVALALNGADVASAMDEFARHGAPVRQFLIEEGAFGDHLAEIPLSWAEGKLRERQQKLMSLVASAAAHAALEREVGMGNDAAKTRL